MPWACSFGGSAASAFASVSASASVVVIGPVVIGPVVIVFAPQGSAVVSEGWSAVAAASGNSVLLDSTKTLAELVTGSSSPVLPA